MISSFAYEVFRRKIATINYLDDNDGLNSYYIAEIIGTYPDVVKLYLDMLQVDECFVEVKRSERKNE